MHWNLWIGQENLSLFKWEMVEDTPIGTNAEVTYMYQKWKMFGNLA